VAAEMGKVEEVEQVEEKAVQAQESDPVKVPAQEVQGLAQVSARHHRRLRRKPRRQLRR